MASVSTPRPKNPVTTRTVGSAPAESVKRAFVFAYVASKIVPFSNSSVVTNMSSMVSTCSPFTPFERKNDAKINTHPFTETHQQRARSRRHLLHERDSRAYLFQFLQQSTNLR